MEQPTFVGIDVSKDSLSIFVWGQPEVVEIANQADAIMQWLSSLPSQALIGLESTNTYHRLVAGLCVSTGRTVYLLQPRDMQSYRRTVSPRGKTDSIDAQVLARYIRHEHDSLRPWKPPTREQELLDGYLATRAFCAGQRASLGQVRKSNSAVAKILKEVEIAMDKAVKALDQVIQATAKRTPELMKGYTRMQSIDGIGPLNAAALGNMFSKYDFETVDAVVAYVGLDPRPLESGKFKGRRKLTKRGPSEIRRLLYNAAMAGAKPGKAWEATKEAYLKRGLPKIAVGCIIARKILRIAWILWKREGETFEPSRIVAPMLKAA